MAVPTFRTWADDDILFASQLNVDIRDNGKFLLNPPQVSVYNSTAQSTPTGVLFFPSFNTEILDESSGAAAAMHDVVTNSGRVVPNAAGLYAAVLRLQFAAQVTAVGLRAGFITLNAARTIIGQQDVGMTSAFNNLTTNLVVSTAWPMNGTTDYFEAMSFHSAGASLNINAGTNPGAQCHFTVVRVG